MQERSGKFAYARRYAIWGRELESLVGLAALNDAEDISDVDDAVAAMTWNENIVAADSDGNVGFWHPGLLPVKPRQWDERLPFPGTGEAEWRGFLPRVRRPHVINPPSQSWLANWNNQPSADWTNGDVQARGRLGGAFHRGNFLDDLVEGFARKPSFAALQKLIQRSGTIAPQRPLARNRLTGAAKGATGNARAVLDTLLDWDGSYHRTAADGTVDPGVATFEEFKAQLIKRDRTRFKAGAAELAPPRTSLFHLFDASNGEAHALRTLNAANYRSAAAATFTVLAERFGSPDPATWREPRRNVTWGVQGLGSPPPMPFFERGTWEQLVELR